MAIFSLIGAAFAYVGGFLAAAVGIPFATAVSIGTAVGQIATGLVLTAVSRALQPNISIPQAEVQAVISQTSAPRRVYIGQALAGGIRAFFDVNEGRLYQIVMVNHGQISEFVQCRIDSRPVTLDGSGNVISGKTQGYVRILTRDGSGQGGNYSPVSTNFAEWNASRRLDGQATFMVSMNAPRGEDFSKVFPKAYNTLVQWVIRGQPIYDPRSELTAYDDNAALCIGHYLTHEDGYRLPSAQINWDSVSAMADISDEAVPQLAGGTAPNLRLWGYWTLDESPVDVLDRMHASSGIRVYEMQDGRVGLIGGPFGTPSCTLTAKDIKDIQTREAISEREGYNVLRVFHMSAAQKYEIVEVDPWRDDDRLAIEGEIVKEYRLEMCPNQSQARRLAKKQIHDNNRARVEIITNLVGLKARFPAADGQRHTVLLDYRPEDGSGRVIEGEYEVMDHEFDPVNLECRIDLAKVDRASEAWTVEEEGSTTEDPGEAAPDLAPDITPVLTQRIVNVTAGISQATLEIDAVPIADRDDIEIAARYRKVGDTQWIRMATSGYSAQSDVVEDGEEYEAQARFRGVFDEPDEWEDLGPITIQIDATPPGEPTELIASNGTGRVHLSWRNPSGAFHEIRIYRNSSSSFGTASIVGTTGGVAGQISEFDDTTVAGSTTYYFWVAAANASGVEGDEAGPANITTP